MMFRALPKRILNPSMTPVWLLLVTWLVLASLSAQFRRLDTLLQVAEYTSSTAILAVGMTFVLLIAGIDLSVGAVMLVAAAVGGKLLVAGTSPGIAVVAMVMAGLGWGLVNGVLVAHFQMASFIVTLAMMFVGRGIGLWITQTKPMNLPDEFRQIATETLAGIPIPIWVMLLCVGGAQAILSNTHFGRQVYAVGFSRRGAEVAGLPVLRIELLAYLACSALAVLAGTITLSQLNVVSPTMGAGRELEAIAAAVLGGVSLFGGRGSPVGAMFGALLFQMVYSGLTILDADPTLNISVNEYFYPLITAAIVFTAVLIDSVRKARFERSQRPIIRPWEVRAR